MADSPSLSDRADERPGRRPGPPRVLLLNPPGDKLYIRDYYCSFSSKASYYWPPQDLIYLSGVLDGSFEVRVLDAVVRRLCPEACLDEILALAPAAVVFTTGTATARSDLDFIGRLKARLPRARIIASAGVLKFLGREFLEAHPDVDAALLDFGESDVVGYLEGRPGPWKSLLVREGGRIVASEAPLGQTYRVPVPRHDLFDFKAYRIPIAKRFPFTVVVTSLGCPFRCGFCTAGAFGYRIRPADNVLPELRRLRELGLREILFQDPTFTINPRRVADLCRGMLAEGLGFTWSANAHLQALDEEMVVVLKKAGCHTLSVGIESGDDGMLEKYSKKTTTAEIVSKVGLLRRHKIKVLGYFILGLPGETRATAERTIALARSLPLDIASFAIATPDLGTRLRAEALERGWIPPGLEAWDSTDFPLMESGGLSREDIWALRKKAVRSFYLRPAYILRKLGGVRSPRDIASLVGNALSLLSK
ncbi:MAG: radical SAM protein [Candidatus Aminicenantes bacterium]|nr:radical SAM protein [Candidatus Aminicenantes bacterium]